MATPTRDAGDELSVVEAVQEIERVEGLHQALEARTSGLTWMVWGLAMAAVFVSYSYVGVVFDAYTSDVEVLFPFLWIPWVIAAVVVTRLLWSSAGLVLELDLSGLDREGIGTGVIFLVLIYGGLWSVQAADAALLEPALVLLSVGVGTTLAGALGLTTRSRSERRAAVVAGGLLAATALVASLLLPESGIGYAWLSLIAPLTTALAYFGIGGLLVARG